MSSHVSNFQRVLVYWSAFGLFVLLAGLLLTPDGSRYATQVNLLLFLPGVLLSICYWREFNLTKTAAGQALLVLLAWVLTMVLLNPAEHSETSRWLKISAMLLVLTQVLTQLVRHERLLLMALLAAVAVAMVCAWGTLVQLYYVEALPMGYRLYRLHSWGWLGLAEFGNAIVAALYYCSMLIIALAIWPRVVRGILSGLLWSFGLLGLLLAIFFTYSRGIWIAGAVALAMMLALNAARRVVVVVGGVAALSLAAVGGFEPALLETVFLNTTYRDQIWLQWWDAVRNAWLLGVGPDAAFNACVVELNQCFNQAHSLYLQFLFEFGVIGLLLLLALMALALRRGWLLRRQWHVALGLVMMVFALVAGIANYHDVFVRPGVIWLVFWLPVALLLSGSAVSSCSTRE